MNPSVVMIQRPDIDFTTFLTLTHQMLGYSIASAVDRSRIEHSDEERFVSCLAAFGDPKAPAGITPNLLTFLSFSILVAADDRDLLDIVECCAGIPVRLTETVSRGVFAAVFHGTLDQWRDAVKTGTSAVAQHNVRACFCNIMGLFEKIGLSVVWKDFDCKSLPDKTFALEYKRR